MYEYHPARKFRKDKDMTQFELGRRIGLSSSWVSKFELLQTTADDAIMERIARILDVTVKKLQNSRYWDSDRG